MSGKPSMLTRRRLIGCGLALALPVRAETGPIIDIHCHPSISSLHNDNWILRHQRRHAITTSILLPIDSASGLSSPLFPKFTIGQNSAIQLAEKYPGEFLFFTTADPRTRGASAYLAKHVKAGARGIGEVKLDIACDSPGMFLILDAARDLRVPVLIHFQEGRFATGFERFRAVVEKYPTVAFIGHAQTWWSNIERNPRPNVLYPQAPVTPGGITDRLLSDYPNVYGDLSAYSGFNSLARDRKHARDFLARHQDKLLFGTDCDHKQVEEGDTCWCDLTLRTLHSLAGPVTLSKILHDNAQGVLTLS